MSEAASPSLRILTLQERVQWLRTSDPQPIQFDAALAEKRLARWCAQAPYDRPEVLEQRLKKDGLTLAQLRLLLGLAGGLVTKDAEAPQWSRLVDLWKNRADAPAQDQLREGRGLLEEGFALLALPAVEEAEEALRRLVAQLSYGNGKLPNVAATALFEAGSALRQQIRQVTTRTMILEMHVAKAQGHLTAEDPEQRYREFLLRLLHPEHSLVLLEEYAVLARLLDQVVEGWLTATSEVFERLASDWDDMADVFPELLPENTLAAIQGGAGDLHRGRRSVHILTFAGGAKLVYKPRSLHLDDHFAALCRWLQAKDASLELRIPPVFSREDYGWCSFVAMSPCATQDAVQRFYRRLGALLAVLHVLQATDFHYENLIAAGEYPTPIDLEALLHARMDEGSSTPMGFLRAIQEDSVLRVGLLPRLLFSVEGQNEGIDISGMGGQGGQLSPTKVMVAEAAYTDEMRIVRRQVKMEASQNLPRMGADSLRASAFVEQIVDGFTAASEAIGQGVDEWSGPGGLLQSFANDRLRLVVRPTMVYAKALHEGFHPNLLRDAVDRDRLLERLWLGCVQRKQLEPFFLSEMRDLNDGEVPAFFFHPNSRQVWDAANTSLGELLEQPTLQLAETASRLRKKDLDCQQWWIRATLAASETTGLLLQTQVRSRVASDTAKPSSEDFLQRAAKIGDRLLETAERHGEWVHWHGLHYYPVRWTAGAVGVDLYNGSAGICLFLAHLGKETGNESYTVAARQALQTSVEYVRQLRLVQDAGSPANPGVFWGVSGLSLCLQQTGELWQESQFTDQAVELLKDLAPTASSSPKLSLGAGTAGFVLTTAAINTQDRELVTLLRHTSEDLMRKLETPEAALELDMAQCVWLEGWCGVGHALVLAGDKLNHAAMVAAGMSAFHRGLREQSDERLYLSYPAHASMRFGADSDSVWKAMLDIEKLHPGSFSDVKLPQMELHDLRALPPGMSLHHGLCAQISLLLDFHLHSPSMGFRDEALRLSTQHLNDIWECDTPAGVETPGLMVGLAGIGTTLLRCGAPHAMRLFRNS